MEIDINKFISEIDFNANKYNYIFFLFFLHFMPKRALALAVVTRFTSSVATK